MVATVKPRFIIRFGFLVIVLQVTLYKKDRMDKSDFKTFDFIY